VRVVRALWRRVNRSLGTKLALVMVLVALLPLVIVSAMGARVTVGRLEREVRIQTRETAQIALNLLLRRVQRIADENARLSTTPELHELVALEPELVPRFLEARANLRTTALVEVALFDHSVVARVHPDHDPEGWKQLYSGPDSLHLRRALNYERYVTLEQVGRRLVVRTAAPIVDAMFVLRGAVATTMPLDQEMADFIRGVVDAEIGFLTGSRPVASTFLDLGGARLAGVGPPPAQAAEVMRGATALTVARVGGREYAVAFTPLQTVGGRRIGMMSVGVSREQLMHAKRSALRSLVLGALGGLIFAVVIAYLVGRRITVPVARLRQSTQAIASGNLDLEVTAETEDEIGDLAQSFQKMTLALREHQDRLAARVRELSTLHQIGRAVSSVLSLDQVLHLVVGEVAEVLGAERGALLMLDEEGGLLPRAEVGLPGREGEKQLPGGWEEMGRAVVEQHGALVEGETLAVPLETRDRVVGALVVARRSGAGPFSESDLRLVVTFCDQAATAIENARLYDEVRAFSEELEGQVQRRTAELREANRELERTLNELKQAQAQLIHSEKMAGLGTLVAGVAHEINTPAASILGSAQALGETLERLVDRFPRMVGSGLTAEQFRRLLGDMARIRRAVVATRSASPVELRHRAREHAGRMEALGVPNALRLAGRIVEAGAEQVIERIIELRQQVAPELVVGVVEDVVYLERTSQSIQAATVAIARLVGTLKTYAHTDQAAVEEVDLTEGLETTLTILHNTLRCGITVTRRYDGDLPKVPVYVDQLNQVWTNLIQNSVQAMRGQGALEIETFRQGDDHVAVRVVDSGPGIEEETLGQIFEPFFTTKPRGEGTGLGLSIAKTIVERHGGRIEVASAGGRTTFTVLLPLDGPPRREEGERDGGE
jgi:two-component system NtrC family sensor kinase